MHHYPQPSKQRSTKIEEGPLHKKEDSVSIKKIKFFYHNQALFSLPNFGSRGEGYTRYHEQDKLRKLNLGHYISKSNSPIKACCN